MSSVQNYGAIDFVDEDLSPHWKDEEVSMQEALLAQKEHANKINELRERYPEAADAELEILLVLDSTIDAAKLADVTAKLAEISPKEIDMPGQCCFSFFSGVLGPPLFSLIVNICAVSATLLLRPGILFQGEYYIYSLPVAVATVAFFGTLPLILQKASVQAKATRKACDEEVCRVLAIKSVENTVLSVASKVDKVNMLLSLQVDAMRSKFMRASPRRVSDKLKGMDPTLPIPIPDPSAYIESELKGAKEEINVVSRQLVEDTDAFAIAVWLPKWMKNEGSIKSKLVGGWAFFFWLLQTGCAVGMFIWLDMEADVSGGTAAFDADSVVGALEEDAQSLVVADTLDSGISILSSMGSEAEVIWVAYESIGWLCLEAYTLSLFQLLVINSCAYTRGSAAAMVNKSRRLIGDQTTLLMKQSGLQFLCKDVLDFRMSKVKRKLLDMIRLGYKLDMLLGVLDANNTTPPRKSPNSSPKSSPSWSTTERWSFFRSSPSPTSAGTPPQ